MNQIAVITDCYQNPPLAGLSPDKCVHIREGVKIVRIPQSMKSGGSSVAIVAPSPEGKYAVIEISLNNFLTAAAILKTAEMKDAQTN